jgi:DNA-binding IclR family transcriptional regulator
LYNASLQGEGMADRITEVLQILNDGQWHLTSEIEKKTKLTNEQVNQLADFLERYDFVAFDQSNKKVRLNEDALKFLGPEPTR